jgi:hypothetical protein
LIWNASACGSRRSKHATEKRAGQGTEGNDWDSIYEQN